MSHRYLKTYLLKTELCFFSIQHGFLRDAPRNSTLHCSSLNSNIHTLVQSANSGVILILLSLTAQVNEQVQWTLLVNYIPDLPPSLNVTGNPMVPAGISSPLGPSSSLPLISLLPNLPLHSPFSTQQPQGYFKNKQLLLPLLLIII